MKIRLPHLQRAANGVGAVLLIWLVAPLLTWQGRHPFESAASRALLMAGAAAIVAALWWAMRWRRSRHNARLLEQLHERHAASDVLAERFGHAVHLLRSGIAAKAGSKLRWWQPRQMLYQLPWYMFIGAPGAGKTTALLHAGLRFPLAERLGASPVAGVGGTRQCDWWFTDQAVFIDTAGRFTTQDSHAASDAKEWQTFLRLLRRYRPVQPINGVIVTVSVPDLLQGGAELEHQASSVDRRLMELRQELGQSFPIYLLVTKSDLLSGFVEFFSDLDSPRREQLWGVVFDAESTGAPLAQDLGMQIAALPARLRAMTPGRMQAEPQVQRRAAIFNFPAQVEALLPAIESFARQAFAAISQTPRQSLRGVCLSSGTQEGNPIDRVLGELSRGFGIAPKPVPRQVESGKAYFLADFLQRLVIPEAPIAGRALQRRQRVRWAAASAGAAVAAALLLSCLAWVVSYRNNRQYLDAVAVRVERVAREVQADHLTSPGPLVPVYALLGGLASSGDINPADPPRGFGFGLFQGPRLAQSAQQSYQRALERTLAPLIVARLEATLRDDKDPIARYEALRVGLMLAQPARLRREEVRRWAAATLAEASSTGAAKPGAGEQGELLRHLDALMDRNALTPLIRLDADTVKSAQASLAKIPLAERVRERIMSRVIGRIPASTTPSELLGPSPDLILAQAESDSPVPVTWEFTRQAWLQHIEPSIEPTVDEVVDEAGWVLGNVPDAPRSPSLDSAAREALARQVAQMHATATADRWDRLLARVALREPADREELSRIGTQLSAPTSPLRLLMRQLEADLGSSTARPSTPAGRAYDAALGERFAAVRGYVQQSGAGAVDRLVAPVQAALADASGSRGVQLVRELRSEASTAPPPFRGVWEALAVAMSTQQRRSFEQQLGRSLSDLAETCRRLTVDRFPFTTDAKRDMPLSDFARLFGPSGLLDSVFRSRLSSQVDVRTRPWRIAEGAALPERAQTTLRSFEMADEIRRLFFAGGSELPQLRLRVTPSSMDDELLNFTADIDGQVLRYENGPRRPRSIVWPGPASSQRILLRILPSGPNGVGAEVQEGPWALLRVMQRGGWQAGPAGTLSATLKVDGRSMKVEVESESAASAALLTRLGRFRCPESW